MRRLLPRSDLAIGVSLSIFTVFMGSSVGAVGKHLSGRVDSSAIVLFQYLICFLCTLSWLLRNGHSALATRHKGWHLIRGISGCACFYTFYLALQNIPLVDATLLRNTAPLVVPLVILVWLKQGVPRMRWLPLALGFAGILVMLRPGQQGVSLWHLVGFSSGVGLAISMVSTRLLATEEPEDRILFYYFLISLLFALPLCLLSWKPIPLDALPWLLYIGFSMYFTFVLYTRAYRYVDAAVLAPTSYFAVGFSALWDWLFWDHLPTLSTLAGATLVVLGGVMIMLTGAVKPKP